MYFACGDKGVVGGKPSCRVDLKLMVKDTAGISAIKVEIAVIGEVHHCVGIRLGLEAQSEDIVIAPSVCGLDIEIAGIVLLGIGRPVSELHAVLELAGVPDAVLETFGTAVQRIGTVVDGQAISPVADFEMSARDAVGITAGTLAEAWSVGDIVGSVGVRQGHVDEAPVTVRDSYFDHTGAESG